MSFKAIEYASRFGSDRWYNVYDDQFVDGVCCVIASDYLEAIVYAYRWTGLSVAANVALFLYPTFNASMLETKELRTYRREIEKYLAIL